MTLKEATKKFYDAHGPQVDNRVQAVGEGDNTIHVYLQKRCKYPIKEFEGYKVVAHYTGKVTAGPAYK